MLGCACEAGGGVLPWAGDRRQLLLHPGPAPSLFPQLFIQLCNAHGKHDNN